VEITGSLNVSGSTSISGGLTITNNGYSWSFNSDGKTRIPNITFNSDRGNGMVGIKPAIGREFQIETSTEVSSAGPWVFGLDGTLTAPAGANIMRVANLITTSSFNTFTSSVNSFTASVNGKTGSFATTGSNVFSGNQIVTGSFDVTSFLNIGTGNGDEGGEMMLVKPITNTNISGSGVIIDAYRDRIRIFEQGGATRGAFLDITKQSNAVSSQIVTSPNLFSIQTITSASYASLTPVSGTLYIIID
jgi:hypothetical protein